MSEIEDLEDIAKQNDYHVRGKNETRGAKIGRFAKLRKSPLQAQFAALRRSKPKPVTLASGD